MKADGSLSLSVESTGGPVADRFFQDIGSYSFAGSASDLNDGTEIEIYRRSTSSGWILQTSTQLSNGDFSVTMPVRERFRIAKMKNPNVYGGNDPVQMEANNTSAFNCRQVVGNPYELSPHSYGTSIEVGPDPGIRPSRRVAILHAAKRGR